MRRKRILVVEDQSPLRILISHTLGRQYEVLPLGSGEEGLAALYRGRVFDCIISDVEMPGISGIQFLRLVRKNELAGNPALLLMGGVALASEEIQAACVELGARFIQKPFRREPLLSIVNQILGDGQ